MLALQSLFVVADVKAESAAGSQQQIVLLKNWEILQNQQIFRLAAYSPSEEIDFDKQAAEVMKMANSWVEEGSITKMPVLDSWKKEIAQAREDYRNNRISQQQLVVKELTIIRQLGQRLTKEIKGADDYFNLSAVLRERKADCLGYTQLFYVLGGALGFKVEPIDVKELMPEVIRTGNIGHVACLFTLSDSRKIMLDGVATPFFMSAPFILDAEFDKQDDYYQQKAGSILRLHRRIQLLDKQGLIGLVYSNLGGDRLCQYR